MLKNDNCLYERLYSQNSPANDHVSQVYDAFSSSFPSDLAPSSLLPVDRLDSELVLPLVVGAAVRVDVLGIVFSLTRLMRNSPVSPAPSRLPMRELKCSASRSILFPGQCCVVVAELLHVPLLALFAEKGHFTIRLSPLLSVTLKHGLHDHPDG